MRVMAGEACVGYYGMESKRKGRGGEIQRAENTVLKKNYLYCTNFFSLSYFVKVISEL